MGSFAPIIASQLNIKVSQVQAVLDLFDEAATIPFIARYRKDKTGGLDEVQIQQIEEASKFLKTFSNSKILCSTFLNLLINQFACSILKSCCDLICLIGILSTIVFLLVKAQSVLTTEESIPPEIPTTNDLGSKEVVSQ